MDSLTELLQVGLGLSWVTFMGLLMLACSLNALPALSLTTSILNTAYNVGTIMFVVWPTMSCFADWSKRYHATFIIIECRMHRGRRFDIANVEPSRDHWPGQVLEFNVALVWHFQPRVHHIWILHSLLCIICIMWFRCCLQTWCHCYFVSALSMFCLLLALSNYACLRFFTVFSQNTKAFQLEFWLCICIIYWPWLQINAVGPTGDILCWQFAAFVGDQH